MYCLDSLPKTTSPKYGDTTLWVSGFPSFKRIVGEGEYPLSWLYPRPVSLFTSAFIQVDLDPRALRRELAALCDRFNYLAASVRTFWAPELGRERQRLREQHRRAMELEKRLGELLVSPNILKNNFLIFKNKKFFFSLRRKCFVLNWRRKAMLQLQCKRQTVLNSFPNIIIINESESQTSATPRLHGHQL